MKKLFMAVIALMMTISASAQFYIYFSDGTVAKVDSISMIAPEENTDEPTTPDIPEPSPDPSTAGGLGVFSVAEGKMVSFAPGNLQFNAAQGSHLRADSTVAKGTWRFAENQWDFVGKDNGKISENYDGWIDLFGWGTSGYDNTDNDPMAIFYQPWSCSNKNLASVPKDSTLNCEIYEITGECEWEYTYFTYDEQNKNYYGYGPSQGMADESLVATSAYYDWGVYNAINNGGNEASSWRSLTNAEWEYLMNTRKNAQFLRSKATVNSVLGYVLLPDDFKKPSDITWSHQTNDWTTNTYSAEQWSTLEALGAVFLPAAGSRNGSNVKDVQNRGIYWSVTELSQNFAFYLLFSWDKAEMIAGSGRFDGFSVRLVKDVE